LNLSRFCFRASPLYDEAKKYWADLLSGYTSDSKIKPVLEPRGYEKSSGLYIITPANDLIESVEELSKLIGVTVSNITEFAWGLFLCKQNYTDDVVFGKVVSGRNTGIPGINQAAGLFINTIPTRINITPQSICRDLLLVLRDQGIESSKYDFYPLVDSCKLSGKGSDLIQCLYIFENYYIDKSVSHEIKGLEYSVDNKQEVTEYPLSLAVIKEENLTFHFNYNPDLYLEYEIETLASHFIRILTNVANHSDKAIADIKLCDQDEENSVLGFAAGERVLLPFSSIAQKIDEQIYKNKKRIALICDNQSITYSEFGNRVNAVSSNLLSLGIQAGNRIAVYSHKSIEMIVGIYAAIKCGCTYIPIDKTLPKDRVQFMLKDSGAFIVLSDDDISSFDMQFINISAIPKSSLPSDFRSPKIDELYILYTSGTTGNPKGVAIREDSVINLVNYLNETVYKNHSHCQAALLASSVFDASVQQIFTALLYGHTLHIITDEVKHDIALMWDYLIKNSISVIDGTPSYLELLLNSRKGSLPVKDFVIGGEPLSPSLIRLIYENCEKPNIFNVYGPTETTVDITLYHCKESDSSNNKISIGKPIYNNDVYVLNENTPCGIGMCGEICISGTGVGNGYVNNDILTKEKFTKSPFDNSTLYRSGDIGFWKYNGMLEIVGRIDQQQKINGYRVELQEIENTLCKMNGVQKAVVLISQEKPNFCAFIVSETEYLCDDYKSFLTDKLPYYMIPHFFINFTELPLTTSGKVDRKALLKYAESNNEIYDEIKTYTKPETENEKRLAEAFSKVLNVSELGIDDDFFALGGDSIQAIRIISLLSDYEVKIKDILENPRIRQLAKIIKSKSISISQCEVTGFLQLLPPYKYFLNSSSESNYSHFNQSMIIKCKHHIDQHAVLKMAKFLVRHHDALRIALSFDGATAYIKPYDEKKVKVSISECQESNLEETATIIQRTLSPKDGMVFKIAYIKTEINYYLLIVLHHFASDAVSLRIIFDDISTLYKQILAKEKLNLPLKTNSLIDWSKQLSESYKSFLSEIDFWKKQLIDDVNTDNGLCRVKESIYEELVIDESLISKLKEKIDGSDISMFEVLLSAFSNAYLKVTSKKEATLFLEGHGRQDCIDLNVSRTIGWFTSIYPIKIIRQSKHKWFSNTVLDEMNQIKITLGSIPNGGLGYSVIDTSDSKYFKSPKKVPMFNYLGEFDSVIDEEAGLVLLPHSAGTEVDENIKIQHAMLVNIALKSQKLYCSFRFDKSVFSTQSMKRLIASFKTNIKKFMKSKPNSDFIDSALKSVNGISRAKNDYVTLSNPKGRKNIFLFPPAMLKIAYVPIYEKLFSSFEDYRV
jgi:amino acid adenylation domain-containing protein/non-ribosomal peptide synthase protein (TIGR01720 family)